jgi:hypothetical protein
MEEWMKFVLLPYIYAQIEILSLEEDQKAVLFLDVYPVHIGLDFRTLVHKDYPNIFLTFVPAKCK